MTEPIIERISYHAVYDESIRDALEYARDHGFHGIQIAVEAPHLSFEALSPETVKEIATSVESLGGFVSIHVPDEAVSLFQHSPILREGIHKYYRALFDFAAGIKAKLVTIHIGSMTKFPTDTRREMNVPENDLSVYRGVVAHNLNTLIDAVAERFTLCVESYAMDEFSLFLLKPYLEDHRLALCWDIAKTWNKPALERFFFSSLDHVKQVHLHDIRSDENGVERSHCVVGSGEIDFATYLNRLGGADILDYCIEVRPREKAKESLDGLKNILGIM